MRELVKDNKIIKTFIFGKDPIPNGIIITKTPSTYPPNMVWNHSREAWIPIKHGEYIKIDDYKDVMPIPWKHAKQYFERNE